MGEAAARIHSRPAVDEGLEVVSDCLVVDIRNVNIESHSSHVLRIQCRPFEFRIGLRGAIAAQYLDLIPTILPMQDEYQVQQPGMDPLPFAGTVIATGPRKLLHCGYYIGAVREIEAVKALT